MSCTTLNERVGVQYVPLVLLVFFHGLTMVRNVLEGVKSALGQNTRTSCKKRCYDGRRRRRRREHVSPINACLCALGRALAPAFAPAPSPGLCLCWTSALDIDPSIGSSLALENGLSYYRQAEDERIILFVGR